MAKFNTGQSFADGDTVTGAKLNNITSQLNVYTGVISEQTAMAATVSTADQLLIADTDNGDSGAANRVTVQKLLNDTLTNGTYTTANLSGNLNVTQLSTLGTISSTNGTIATLNSTTGTITGLRSTTGTVATLNSTTGTVATLNSTTGTITGLNSTNGTVATLNSTTGTITGLNSTNGTVATLNSTTGTITNLRSTTGTVATLNSTTGTITNLTTTLTGDLTISTGSATVGTRVAVVNTAQEYTAAHNFNATTLTSGTTIPWDLSANQVARLVLSTNGTMNDATNKVDGSVYILLVTQGTGSNTLAWDATYKWSGGTSPTLTTGSAKSDIFTFVSNGTSLFGVASQNYS
jgi:hypothetical protein